LTKFIGILVKTFISVISLSSSWPYVNISFGSSKEYVGEECYTNIKMDKNGYFAYIKVKFMYLDIIKL
jgi:hypothetical protein